MFEQERMIGRLQRRVNGEAAIKACFLSGSFGRYTDDDYSDVDVALVFRDDDARKSAWESRSAFAQSIMPYVTLKSFAATHIRPYFYIALFANGTKLDMRHETADSLLPNPWDSQIRILKDSDDWAASFQLASSHLAIPRPRITAAELSALDQRFWVMFWDVLRQLARGDAERPFEVYLQLLYFTLPTLLNALPSAEPARQQLIGTTFSRDAKATAKQLQSLLEAYLQARSAVVRRHHLQYVGDGAFEAEIQRQVQKLIT